MPALVTPPPDAPRVATPRVATPGVATPELELTVGSASAAALPSSSDEGMTGTALIDAEPIGAADGAGERLPEGGNGAPPGLPAARSETSPLFPVFPDA